ncbi:unnamed protein product [Brassica rapa]|uniref:Uncharacterized protein n=3 Tax=Brassica TaxID=3705 RepID=A0A8D9HYG9_BRACM|nr:unnamed protein product [Brassica napus]CAG7905884.1 unnamed protein product [Brassica rapa]
MASTLFLHSTEVTFFHLQVSQTYKESHNSSVSFPYNPAKNMEPLKFEAEGSSGRTSNSFVLWQVYALGGFLVLKWACARWNERKETTAKRRLRMMMIMIKTSHIAPKTGQINRTRNSEPEVNTDWILFFGILGYGYYPN